MEGFILYHITIPVLCTQSTGIVTIVPDALTRLSLVNTVLVSANTTITFNMPAPSFVVWHRNKPELTDPLAQVTYVPVRPRTLVWRVLHLLREHGGHRHLRLRAHVSVLHLWPQTQENVQRLLSHLQKTDQRHYQDIPQHVKVDHLRNTRSGFLSYELWYFYHSVIINWFCCVTFSNADVSKLWMVMPQQEFTFKPLLWSKRVTLRTNISKSRRQQSNSWQRSKQRIVERQLVSLFLRFVQDKPGSLWLLWWLSMSGYA